MYRILQKVFDNGMESTYKFVTKVENRKVIYHEFNSKQEVDEYVEFQLNGGIPKTSLEVVEYIPYTVTADLLANELYTPAPENNYTLLDVPQVGVIGQPIAFRVDCEFSKFQGVKVNGVPIHNSMYSVTSGSTIVEFKAEYMAQLAEGEYKFTFLFEDGIAEAVIRINLPSEEEDPSEGEDQPVLPPADEEGNDEPSTPADPDSETPEESDPEEPADPDSEEMDIEDAELF